MISTTARVSCERRGSSAPRNEAAAPSGIAEAIRLPGGLDHIAVRIHALHADVVRLVPFLGDRHTVGGQAVTERQYRVARRQADPEVQEARHRDRVPCTTQRE